MVIMDDEIRLECEINLPKAQREPCPIVVLFHGFTGNKDEPHLLAVTQALNEAGAAVLRADLYGHGKSGGSFENHTLFKWIGNAMTLMDAARKMEWSGDLYLCGHSQGGLLAMLAAGMKRDQVKGVIALAPALMIPEGARRGRLLGEPFDPDHVPESLPAWGGLTLNGNYVRVAQTIDVRKVASKYTGPLLLVHGTDDGAVPAKVSVAAAKYCQGAELHLIEGDGHCFERHLEEMTETVKDWMTRRLAEDEA